MKPSELFADLTPDQPLDSELHLTLVRMVAKKVYHATKKIADYEDLVQEGWLALENATRTYKDGKSNWPAHAWVKVEYGLYDYLRRVDHLSRAERKKAKKLEEAGESYLIPLSIEDLRDRLGFEGASFLDSQYEELENRLVLEAFERWLADQRWFSKKYRVVYENMIAGEPQANAARLLGITESRVSQMVSIIFSYARDFGVGTPVETTRARGNKSARKLLEA